MKIRLPRELAVCLLAAIAMMPVQIAAATTTITPDNYIKAGDKIVDNIGNNGGYSVVAKDGSGTATVEGTVKSSSAIYVREGNLLVGGDSDNRAKLEVSYEGSLSNPFIIAGQENATLTVSNADFVTASDGYNYVGSHDGAGTMIVEKGSNVNLRASTHLIIGAADDAPYDYSNSTLNADGTPYEGSMTVKENGATFGRGVITVKEGSTFQAGYSSIWLSEGEINVIGQGVDASLPKTVFNMGSASIGYKFVMGLDVYSDSAVNVTNSGEMNIYTSSFYTGFGDGSRSVVNVDGEGSQLNIHQLPGDEHNIYLGYGAGSETTINVTNKGAMNFYNDSAVYLGVAGRNAALNVGEGSSFFMDKGTFIMGDNAEVKNEGTVEVNNLSTSGYYHNMGTTTVTSPTETTCFWAGSYINDGTTNAGETQLLGGVLENNNKFNLNYMWVAGGELINKGDITDTDTTDGLFYVYNNSTLTNYKNIAGNVNVAVGTEEWGTGTYVAKMGSSVTSLNVRAYGKYVAEGDNSMDSITVTGGEAAIEKGVTVTARWAEVKGGGSMVNYGALNQSEAGKADPSLYLLEIIGPGSTFSNYGSVEDEITIKDGAHMVAGDGSTAENIMVIDGTLEVEGMTSLSDSLTLSKNGKLQVVLSGANKQRAAVEVGGDVQTEAGSEISVSGFQNMKAGQRYLVFNRDVDLDAVTITFDGVVGEALVDDGALMIVVTEDLYVDRDPMADVLGAAAWGVFKSSQAFTGSLWGCRTNSVVLNTRTETSSDAKGGMVKSVVPSGRTLAWAAAYGEFSRLSSNDICSGAEYSIYGGALGLEHQFVSGRSLGMAVGYDWGKVSPFNGPSVDQETVHAAVYGRAGQWNAGQKGVVALDVAAAVGSTDSEITGADMSQNSVQLDTRVTYIRQLTEKTSVSAFAGVQYYAQEDAEKGDLAVGSMQNLRTILGAGFNYAATDKLDLFAEARVYNDAMRHNPEAVVDGFREKVTSPGRLGGGITAGAAYQLNDDWTLRGSYSFEAADRSTEHSVNAGAVYTF